MQILMQNLTMHFNHGLSNKYKNLFKSAAISIVQNVLNKFIPKDLFQIDCAIVILKLNITLIISVFFFACTTFPSNHVTSLFRNYINYNVQLLFLYVSFKIVNQKKLYISFVIGCFEKKENPLYFHRRPEQRCVS